MSLIFKALQRFDSPGVTQDKGHPELPVKRNAVTLRKLLLSPRIALTVAAAILLVGLVVFQAIHLFSLKMKPLTPTVQAAMPEQTVAMQPAAKTNIAVDADYDPEIIQPASAKDAQRVSFQVHPPEPDTSAAVNASAASDQRRYSFVDSDNGIREGGDSPHSEYIPPTRKAVLRSNERLPVAFPSNKDQKEAISKSKSVHPSKMLSLVRRDAASSPKISDTASDVVGPSSSALFNSPKHSEQNPEHQRQADQATKHLNVSQLANRIYGAIQSDDVDLTSHLLAKLMRMKGSDNPFVLKLKAFSLIRQNRLEEARTLLSNVLARSADDLDAGLNMAVIDMKSGRLGSARRRLVKLQEMFPDDTNITTYLSKLAH